MLTYAVKLTLHPADLVETDVRALRDSGFSDVDILHIAEVTSYFAYVNRMAHGLGVPLETWIPDA
ncbi:MAG: peroxidase [Acidobacteria bacterium]|nr:peroxidase [Acidobacteriota bacterium]